MANTFSNTTRAADTGTGLFTARSYSARNALPVAGVRLTLTGEDGTKWTAETGEDGLFSALPLACPPRSLSLDEANTQRPYGVYAWWQSTMAMKRCALQACRFLTVRRPWPNWP